MSAHVMARPLRMVAAALLLLLLVAGARTALALEGVEAQAGAPKDSYPANTWVPLTVSVDNENATYDITVHEAGFKALPDGLEMLMRI